MYIITWHGKNGGGGTGGGAGGAGRFSPED